MARHRKIAVRMWGDEKFRKLTPAPPNAQTLWIYLLTGPHTTSIPGLFVCGEKALAEALGWDLKAFRKAFEELFRAGMVQSDWTVRVVWIPKAISHNPPESPNVVKNWRGYWDDIPECGLKFRAARSFAVALSEMGTSFFAAFQVFGEEKDEGLPEAFQEDLPEDYGESGTGAGTGAGTGVAADAGLSGKTTLLDPSHSSLDSDAFADAWRDWLAYRAEMKRPYKPRAERAALDHLAKFGSDVAVKAIRISIRNQWHGVFPEKVAAPTNGRLPPTFDQMMDLLDPKESEHG